MDRDRLRPFERVVQRLTDQGMTSSEIAWRFRRSPGHIERVLDLSRLPRPGRAPARADEPTLRPVERTVMRARENGSQLPEIAARMRRTPSYVARVEEIATYKLQAVAGGTSS
jgi:DNA-binding CsgD family transcriptional regulator